MSDNNIQTRWYKPVNRLGRFTLIVAMILSFGPFLYIVVRFNVMPPVSAIGVGFINITSAFAVAWVVEPISYFPALGTTGTYMGILAGSIGQMRVPAALVAKSVAGVEENTQEAELIATCGIAGSVFMNCIITTITALAGTLIISVLPESVMAALTDYILPGIFGAVMAMFTTKGKMQITIPTLLVAIGLNWLNMEGYLPGVLSKLVMFFCVVIGIGIARFEYKKGWAK